MFKKHNPVNYNSSSSSVAYQQKLSIMSLYKWKDLGVLWRLGQGGTMDFLVLALVFLDLGSVPYVLICLDWGEKEESDHYSNTQG